MAGIRFQPWIGPKYKVRGSMTRRTLVLGESYYEIDPLDPLPPEPTRAFIESQIDGKNTWPARRARFYTSIVRAFLNPDRAPTLEEKREFWNSVCHYTFIQAPVGGKARIRQI